MNNKLFGQEIFLRFLELDDAAAMYEFYRRNREFLAPWEPKWPDSFYSRQGQRDMVERLVAARQSEQSFPFGIFLKQSNELIGRITLSNITRSFFLNSTVGYALAQQHNGHGYMTEAVRLVLNFAFTELGLHRVQAGTLRHNYGSMKVLEKAGFRFEGTALRYLKIADQWQDHNIFAITAEEFTPIS